MEVTMGFTGANQAVYVLDQVNPTINLSGKTITVVLTLTSGCTSALNYDFYSEPYIEEGSATAYGKASAQLYGSAGSFVCNGTGSACLTLTMPVPSTPVTTAPSGFYLSGGPFDPTQVQYIGIQIGAGGSGSGFGTTIADIKSWTYQ